MSKQRTAFLYFDAGFTLIKPAPSVGHQYAEVARSHGLEADPGRLDAGFVAAWRAAIARNPRPRHAPAYGRTMDEARVFWGALVVDVFRRAGSDVNGLTGLQTELFDRFASGSAWQLYPDALPAMDRLAEAGIPMGILSNWDPRLRLVLRDMGLEGRFREIILSCEIGYEKPHRAIFEAARQRVGAPPAAAMGIIGDDPETDGVGGRDAGWRSCVISRSGPGMKAPEGVFLVHDLTAAIDHFLG